MKKLLSTLQGTLHPVPPLWLMRQAGRYLPEYRTLREQAGSFLSLCFTPDLATEVTLQPIRRFNFDAAIIFADILLLPHALGCNLRFTPGEGPQLDPISDSAAIAGKNLGTTLDPVYAALRQTRQALPDTTTLIGFCGAPYTVACYMFSGGGSKNFSAAQHYAKTSRADFIATLNLIADYSVIYLSRQIAAGADCVQLFDSWAGLVTPEDFGDFIIAPAKRIVSQLHALHPATPIIGFPRGAAAHYRGYAAATGVQAVGLDQTVRLAEAALLQNETIVQGNLDPALLVQGGKPLAQAVQAIKQALGKKPYIFNLGHGITPETPPEHVAALVELVRQT